MIPREIHPNMDAAPIGTIAALRDENERLRMALEYAEDACARALRLGEGDRRSDRMAYQVIDEASRVLARALHWTHPQREDA